jgi:hypothetical protein
MGYPDEIVESQANHWLLRTKKEGCALRTPNPNRENLTHGSPAIACQTPMGTLLKESQRAALTCVKFVKN